MKKIHTRFGEIEYDPASVLHFPAGLIGLPNLQNFVVMPNKKKGPLFWIQSIDDTDFAFVLTDPTNFFLDYTVVPEKAERTMLHMDEEDQCFILALVTVPQDQDITLNLAAPILYAPQSNRAIQVILENSEYGPQTPLPKPKPVEEEKEEEQKVEK